MFSDSKSRRPPKAGASRDTGVFEGMLDGMHEWMGSEEGQLVGQVLDVTWGDLEEVEIDVEARRLVWEDGAALTIRQSAQRILDTVEPGQGFTLELIEMEIIQWLEMGHEPPQQTEAEAERREERIDEWIEAHRMDEQTLDR